MLSVNSSHELQALGLKPGQALRRPAEVAAARNAGFCSAPR